MPAALALALALAVFVVAAACSSGSSNGALGKRRGQPTSTGSGSTAPSATTGRPRPSPSGAPGPGTAPTAHVPLLTWASCSKGDVFQCATLQVPLDWSRPGGAQITLALNRLPAADPAGRIGTLVINPGGPGASGLDYARSARSLLSPALLSRFDVIGFDPRGVGKSSPVTCVDGPTFDRTVMVDPVPDDPAERDALLSATKGWDAGCSQHTSAALLAHVSTLDAARDLDAIRAALGEERLTYLGKSYGTFLGATYAQLFPDKVRALVLDGAIDPTLSWDEFTRGQAAGFERQLDNFLADCSARPACRFHSGGNAAGAFDRLMAAIDANPMPTGDPARPLTRSVAILGVVFSLYDPPAGWPVLERALAAAAAGNGAGLQELADLFIGRHADGTHDNTLEANTAIDCIDEPWPTDLGAYDRLAAELAQSAPRLGQEVVYPAFCAFWPVPAVSTPRPLTAPGAPPILVVGTTGDPATPYPWAVHLAQLLQSGVLLTWRGEGHTAYHRGSSCIDGAVDRYLVDLQAPARGTTC